MLEFGWKEDAYAAFEAGYKAKLEGSSDVQGTIEKGMPLIVHVRDQGGRGWEKDWRMAQLGWWHNNADHVADWGAAHEEVVKKGKGRILRLTHLEDQDFKRPMDMLDALEMFCMIALLVHRVAVLPEIPCALTQLEWSDEACPDRDPGRWYVVYANETQRDPAFHCTMNERRCRKMHTCLASGWLHSHLEPYFTTGSTFHRLFPGPAREMDAPEFAMGETTSAGLQEHFAQVADVADVAINAAHLPRDVTQLNDADHKALLGCLSNAASDHVLDCIVNGQDSKKCSELDDSDSRVRKEINGTTPVEVTWKVYDHNHSSNP